MLRKERNDADERNRLAFEELIRQGEQIKKQREIEVAKNGYSILGATGSNGVYNPYSMEEIIPVPEHPELKEIREKRLQEILSKDENEMGNRNENNENNIPNSPSMIPQVPMTNSTEPPPLPTPSVEGIEPAKEESVKWTKFQITEASDEEENDELPGESAVEKPPSHEMTSSLGEIGVEDINLNLDEEEEITSNLVDDSTSPAENQTTDLYELD